MPEEKLKPVPVPTGDGVRLKLHRKCEDGSHEEREVHVTRGRLCSDWFKVLCREDGHYDLYSASGRGEADLRGAPQLCGVADHAASLGWKWGPAPKPERRPLALKVKPPGAK